MRFLMIPHDYHIHSHFSCDSKATLAEMCQGAIDKGILEIGFSEHFDLHPADSCRNWFQPEPWWVEIERCREAFDGRLTIRAGIEIGEPHIYGDECRAVLAGGPFDYVLGSLHYVGPAFLFGEDYFHQHPADEVFQAYFEELECMTRCGGFDILGHFDGPVRKAMPVYGEYHPRRYEEYIRAVLQNCIERGIALDVNTSAFRQNVCVLIPGYEILRWYAEMGGERITLGSDAHTPEYIGLRLDEALETARAAGLRYITQFEKRQARLVLM